MPGQYSIASHPTNPNMIQVMDANGKVVGETDRRGRDDAQLLAAFTGTSANDLAVAQRNSGNQMTSGMKKVDDLAASMGYDTKKAESAKKFAELGKTLEPSEKAQASSASAQSLRNSMGLLANTFSAMQSDEPTPFNKIPTGSAIKRATHWLSGNKDLMNFFGKDQNDAIETYRSQIGATALKKLSEMSGGTGAGSARLAARAEALVPGEYADWGSFGQKLTNLYQELEGTRAAAEKEPYNPSTVQNTVNELLQKNMPPKEFELFKNSNFYKGLVGEGKASDIAPVQPSGEDAQALSWAQSNPTDPRAQKILQLHGGQ